MKTSMRAIAFDPSNGANYIYLAYIHRFQHGEYTRVLYDTAFSTLAFAMQMFNPYGNPDKWQNESGVWSLDFTKENPMSGYKVEVTAQLLVVA